MVGDLYEVHYAVQIVETATGGLLCLIAERVASIAG